MLRISLPKSTIATILVSVAFSAMMTGHSYSQAGGNGGGGGGGGNPSSGSPTIGRQGAPVPSNSNKFTNPGGPIIDNPHPKRPERSSENRGCVGEQRTSRDSTNQRGCDNRRLRVIVQ
jgi:hypothetical protein